MAFLTLQKGTTIIGKLILLSNILFLITGCFGREGSDCDGGPQGACTNYVKCIDTLYLDSAINKVLPNKIDTKISFKNSNGFVTSFDMINSNVIKYSYQDLVYKSVSVTCGSLSCYDFILKQNKYTNYKASDVPFNYSYNFETISTTDKYKYSTDSILSGYSIATIYVNSIAFPLAVNRTNSNSRIVDSININNKFYFNVNQIYLDSSTIDYSIIKPIGIYHNEEFGLIGFYLTNGETWGLN